MRALARGSTALAAIAALALPMGCDTTAQFAPSLPTAAGHRVNDGELRFWTGAPCGQLTAVTVTFDLGSGDDTVWEVTAPEPGQPVDYLTLNEAPEGFDASEPLPDGFDWTAAETVSVYVRGPDAHWGSEVDVETIIEESPEHPDDAYFFDDEVGWLDLAGVEEKNSEDFLTVCTPDPESEAGAR